MSKIIIVEGKSDKEFLEYFMRTKEIKFKQIIPNDSNYLTNATLTQIIKALDDNLEVYILFDADSSPQETRKRLEKELEKVDLTNERVKIFLFPNDKNSGELENLLYDVTTKPEIITCFDKYTSCIDSIDKNLSKNINKKSKIYAYKEASGLQKELDKASQGDIKKKLEIFNRYFNFDSEKLEPLKDFLKG